MKIQNPRVLYIEDHEDTRELVTLLLTQKSYEVITGATIESGIALATAGKFDLYLLDSWLPDGSGLDLCAKIREFDKTTPILFYSAAAYASDHDTALKCGAQAYLIKPSQPADLCKLVSDLIADSRSSVSGRQMAQRIIPDNQRQAAVAAVKTSQKVQYD
jgi:DNA-binding response OmpR family regulator